MAEPDQPQQTEEGPLPHTHEAVDWWLNKWGRQEVAAGNEPLTRQDVVGLIEVNGGTVMALDLVGRDLHGSDLSSLDLKRANLRRAHLEGADLDNAQLEEALLSYARMQGAILFGANLQGANLRGANLREAELNLTKLERADLEGANLAGADLSNAYLEGAYLLGANLQGANLEAANLESATLAGATISDATNLEGVRWDLGYISVLERGRFYEQASALYRRLKIWHLNHGLYDIQGEFHQREWECKLAQQEKNWGEVVLLWLSSMLYGHGENPWRVIAAGAAVIAFFALAYFPYSGSPCFEAGCWVQLWERIWQALYFSGVSFTALGYGDFVTTPGGWTRYLGVVESLVGISLIALFLVTFTRKMTR